MQDFVESFKFFSGENLKALYQSDDNYLLVLDKIDIAFLDKIKDTIVRCRKDGKIPLLFTSNELQTAADVFLLEFLYLRENLSLIVGNDLLARIKFDKKHVRRQLEYELRSKLIHLRENYVLIESEKDLRQLLENSATSLLQVIYGLLFLKDAMHDKKRAIAAVSELYDIDTSVLTRLKDKDVKAKDLTRMMRVFLDEITEKVDAMEF